MTLSNIVTFDILSYYDGKIKNWVKALRPTATEYYEEGDEIPEGKQIGDVKVQGHNGVVTYAEWKKLTDMIGINGLKINLTGSASDISADGNGNYTIDVTSKADKVSGATADNFAGLDSNGNLKDSGKSASDFATNTQGGYADSALQEIEHGTDGSYITVSVGTKSGNSGAKKQTISASVTTVNPANAAADNNGLATALDVKNFVASTVAAGINYRGSVANYSALLAIASPEGGDMYNVQNDETISGTLYPGDMNYVYVEAHGESGDPDYVEAFWDPQSPTINISSATTSQIDSLFA